MQNVNYPGLRTLYDKYNAKGFNLIAFPCNQFGGQAPGTSQEEREYAIKKFGFEFDVFDKIDVNGSSTHPLYRYMRSVQPTSLPRTAATVGEKGAIEWNYVKFLVNRDGVPMRRYRSIFDPLQFEGDVRLLLAKKDFLLPEDCLLESDSQKCNVDKYLTA